MKRFKWLRAFLNRMCTKSSLSGRPSICPSRWQTENAQCLLLNDRPSVHKPWHLRRRVEAWSWRSKLLCVALAICASAQAQDYSIDWHTIGGGGGNSANGQFSVNGTIGQACTGTIMTNCCWEFTVISGFWVLPPPLPPEGPAPLLSIVPAAPG